MIDAGDVHLADLNEERRRRVLVLSNRRFHQIAGRAVVAPEVEGGPDAVPFPWRVEVDDVVYGVDLLRSVPLDRLLDRVDSASHDAVMAARRAISHIH